MKESKKKKKKKKIPLRLVLEVKGYVKVNYISLDKNEYYNTCRFYDTSQKN